MNKSVKSIICVLVVSDLMLATCILTQNNKKTLKLFVYGGAAYIAKYIRNTMLLSRKQTFKKCKKKR